MNMRFATKKGSFTLEAAIFLPMFVIGVLTIGYILKVIAIQENIFHAFADETRIIAAEAQISPYPVFFEGDVTGRVSRENEGETENARLSDFAYRYGFGAYTEQIRATLRYDVRVKLPAPILSVIPVSDTILCRAFVGTEHTGALMPPEELAEAHESVTVWIFPRSGTKYHGQNCSYVVAYPREVALTESIRRAYEPCKLCGARDMGNGSVVYCFQKTGAVFHKGSCTVVDKYVVPIEKDEAESRGYTPCLKCNGK